jgi:hypothetical protein
VKRNSGRVLAAGLSVLALMSVYWEAETARAYHQANHHTVESLDRASQLAPKNAVFWRERGVLRLDADPQAAEEFLKRSMTLNAFEAEALIGLALLAESGGRVHQAESDLIRATHLSRRFRPIWALAFFYARQGKLDQFWPVASTAANIEGADATPLFRLCHQISPDPERIAELLQLHNQHTLLSYLEFLLKQKNTPTISQVAQQITLTPESRSVLLNVVDRLINETRIIEAVQIWNHLNSARETRPLSPTNGISLSDGQFASSEGRGFDWRHAEHAGVELRAGAPGDLRIEFSGHQKESLTLLEQFVPVLPDRVYRFSFTYGTAGLNDPTGLHWEVFPSTDPLVSPLNSAAEGSGYLAFRAGPDVGLVRIALVYKRAPGTTRLEGIVTLRSASLDLL